MKNNIISKSQYINKKHSLVKEIIQWILTLGGTILIALFILGNVFAFTGIDGESMESTLHHKDRVITYKLGNLFTSPKTGDIVIVNKQKASRGIFPNMWEQAKDIVESFKNRINKKIEVKYIVKRIIGLPGDKIDIKNGKVFVNGGELEEVNAKGITVGGSMNSYPITIPEGKYFILGDNRQNSLDSRDIGLIDRWQIKGKVVFRVLPINRIGKLD